MKSPRIVRFQNYKISVSQDDFQTVAICIFVNIPYANFSQVIMAYSKQPKQPAYHQLSRG